MGGGADYIVQALLDPVIGAGNLPAKPVELLAGPVGQFFLGNYCLPDSLLQAGKILNFLCISLEQGALFPQGGEKFLQALPRSQDIGHCQELPGLQAGPDPGLAQGRPDIGYPLQGDPGKGPEYAPGFRRLLLPLEDQLQVSYRLQGMGQLPSQTAGRKPPQFLPDAGKFQLFQNPSIHQPHLSYPL